MRESEPLYPFKDGNSNGKHGCINLVAIFVDLNWLFAGRAFVSGRPYICLTLASADIPNGGVPEILDSGLQLML